MLFARYYFTDKLALRVAFGLNSLGTKTTGEDTAQGGIYQITENKLSAFSFGIGGGVEYHCADNSRRIDPYFGGQLNFGMIGPINIPITIPTKTSLFSHKILKPNGKVAHHSL
jgi:hypothetical protein